MGKAEFWRLTPLEIDALIVRRDRDVQHRDLMFGQLIAMVANTGFRSYDKPREPKEFMPSEWARQAPAKAAPKRLTRKQQAARDLFFMKHLMSYQDGQVNAGIA